MWGREIIIHVSFSANSCKINSKPMFCFVLFFTLSAYKPCEYRNCMFKKVPKYLE